MPCAVPEDTVKIETMGAQPKIHHFFDRVVQNSNFFKYPQQNDEQEKNTRKHSVNHSSSQFTWSKSKKSSNPPLKYAKIQEFMHPDEIVVSTTPEASPAPAEEVPDANIHVSQLTLSRNLVC